MSKQTIKDVNGIGRKITKDITLIERNTPSIIYFESRLQDLETGLAANDAIDATQNDRIFVLEGVDIPVGTPAGMVIAFSGVTIPPGYLECNGGLVDSSTYPDLYAAIGTTYNIGGEPAGQFRLPDLRGEFIRGLDSGRGVDSGRTLGSWQDHLIESHDHSQAGYNLTLPGTQIQWYNWSNATKANNQTRTGYTGGSETRPRNLALFYCIKAFDAITDPDMVLLTSLANDVAINTSDIAVNTSDIAALAHHAVFGGGGEGYANLPGGLKLKWGTGSSIGGDSAQTITFGGSVGGAFPTECMNVQVSSLNSNSSNDDVFMRVRSKTKANFVVRAEAAGAQVGTRYCMWFAIGH